MIKLYIPAYKLSDLELFCPLGKWHLVSETDITDILAIMVDGDMSAQQPTHLLGAASQANMEGPTLILEEAA